MTLGNQMVTNGDVTLPWKVKAWLRYIWLSIS